MSRHVFYWSDVSIENLVPISFSSCRYRGKSLHDEVPHRGSPKRKNRIVIEVVSVFWIRNRIVTPVPPKIIVSWLFYALFVGVVEHMIRIVVARNNGNSGVAKSVDFWFPFSAVYVMCTYIPVLVCLSIAHINCYLRRDYDRLRPHYLSPFSTTITTFMQSMWPIHVTNAT